MTTQGSMPVSAWAGDDAAWVYGSSRDELVSSRQYAHFLVQHRDSGIVAFSPASYHPGLETVFSEVGMMHASDYDFNREDGGRVGIPLTLSDQLGHRRPWLFENGLREGVLYLIRPIVTDSEPHMMTAGYVAGLDEMVDMHQTLQVLPVLGTSFKVEIARQGKIVLDIDVIESYRQGARSMIMKW